MASRLSRKPSSACSIRSETWRSAWTNGLSAAAGRRFSRTVSAIAFTQCIQGFRSENRVRSSRAGLRARIARAAASLDVLLTSGEARSEEHTSELQSRLHLVCRLLLEKKKKKHVTA